MKEKRCHCPSIIMRDKKRIKEKKSIEKRRQRELVKKRIEKAKVLSGDWMLPPCRTQGQSAKLALDRFVQIWYLYFCIVFALAFDCLSQER